MKKPAKISHLFFTGCWCWNINTELISVCTRPLYSMPMHEFLPEDWTSAKPHIKLQWLLRPLRPFHLLKNEIRLLFIGLKPPKFDLYLAYLYPLKWSRLWVRGRKFRVSQSPEHTICKIFYEVFSNELIANAFREE